MQPTSNYDAAYVIMIRPASLWRGMRHYDVTRIMRVQSCISVCVLHRWRPACVVVVMTLRALFYCGLRPDGAACIIMTLLHHLGAACIVMMLPACSSCAALILTPNSSKQPGALRCYLNSISNVFGRPYRSAMFRLDN